MRKLRHEEGKVTYIVYCPWDIKISGGQVALHMLTKNLADQGEIVYTLSKPMFSCNAKTIKSEYNCESIQVSPIEFDPEKTVVIYPEIIRGNPIGAKRVVRWILYNTIQSIEDTWNPLDELWYYLPFFETSRKEDKKLLSAFDFKLNLLRDRKKEPSKENVLLLRKRTPELDEWSESIKMEEPSSMQDFAEKVSDFKFFYTYDDATYYSIAASLVGCTSIILDPRMDPEEYRKKNPIFLYGVAFGTELDEIERAEKTKKLLRPHLLQLERESIHQIKAFIKHWKAKIYDL
jgi:hypothetical protein